MIVVLKSRSGGGEKEKLIDKLLKSGALVRPIGAEGNVLVISGDAIVDTEELSRLSIVERISEEEDDLCFVRSAKGAAVCGKPFGTGRFELIAGPCAVESYEQAIAIASAVKKSGATMFRGGAFKPRTSPYAFQGLGKSGIEILSKVRKLTGLPVVSEVVGVNDLDLFADVDVLQIGARNMQNYELLRAVGRSGKPVVLKRGFASTVREWLLSAEYIMAAGNFDIILCERGVRTFAQSDRATVDFASVAAVKKVTGLPVIVDPSHASSSTETAMRLALAAAAFGADGVMLEVHNDPKSALCDGEHQLSLAGFDELSNKITKVCEAIKQPLS